MIRILIADRQEIACEGVKSILEGYGGFDITGHAGNPEEVAYMLRKFNIDVMIMDFFPSEGETLTLIRNMANNYPTVGILLLSAHADMQQVSRAISAGVRGYLSKATESLALAESVRRVAEGRPYVSDELAQYLMTRLYAQNETGGHNSLSMREFDIFVRLAKGTTSALIASELGLSVKTVAAHKANILAKLGLANLARLIQYAIFHNLVPCRR